MPLLGSLGSLRSNFLSTAGIAQGTGWGLGMVNFTDGYEYKISFMLSDNAGNTYAIGYYDAPNSVEDYASIVKLDSNGTIIWNKGFTITGATTRPTFTNAKMDNLGNLVITGTYKTGTPTIIFVTKIASNGTVIVTKSMPNRVIATGEIAIDSSNNIFIKQLLTTTQGLISKYDPSLNIIKQITVTKPTSISTFSQFFIDIDYNDNLVIGGGGIYGAIPTNSYLTTSIDNTLTTVQYSNIHYGTSRNLGVPQQMIVDNSNSVCLLLPGNHFMMRVNSSGIAEWALAVTSSTGAVNKIHYLGGYIYITDFSAQQSGTDVPANIFKMNPISGTILWQRNLEIEYTRDTLTSNQTYLQGLSYYNDNIYCGSGWYVDSGRPNWPTSMPVISRLPANGAIPGSGTYVNGVIATGRYTIRYTSGSPTLEYFPVATVAAPVTLANYTGNVGNVTTITGSIFDVSTTVNTLIPYV